MVTHIIMAQLIVTVAPFFRAVLKDYGNKLKPILCVFFLQVYPRCIVSKGHGHHSGCVSVIVQSVSLLSLLTFFPPPPAERSLL